MTPKFLDRINHLNALQRTWVVVSLCWITGVGYVGYQEFPTETQARSRAYDYKVSEEIRLRNELAKELQSCAKGSRESYVPEHITQLNCEIAIRKRHGEEVRDIREFGDQILHISLQGLERRQLDTTLTLLALALLPPILVYAVVYWIASGTRPKQGA